MTFVIVKDTKRDVEFRVNPNCYIRIVYNYIKEKLEISENTVIDLSTTEGDLCLLSHFPPNTNAMEVLTPRETYTVVEYNEKESDEYRESLMTLQRLSLSLEDSTSLQEDHNSQEDKKEHLLDEEST